MNPFQQFERQIVEEKSMIKELKEAFDLIADKLVAAEQRERDLKALLARAADKIEKTTRSLDFVHQSVWEAYEIPELIAELRKAAEQ